MLKAVGMILLAMALAIILTLSAVTSIKINALEGRIDALQKMTSELGQKLGQSLQQAQPAEQHGSNQPSQFHWGYAGDVGPARWGEHFPLCGSGKSQAPIDIRGPFEKAAGPLKFDYKPIPLKILNNGHTLQVNVAPGSSLTVNGQSYALVQFHFHRPSEELVEGKPAAMVAHFVHKNEAGNLAVVGVLLNEGRPNDVIKAIWAHAPAREGPEVEISGTAINPAQMLPSRLDYYTYEGSLTTPPCTEGVQFYILKAGSTVSRDQVRAFPFELNARPVMPLNGRKVYTN